MNLTQQTYNRLDALSGSVKAIQAEVSTLLWKIDEMKKSLKGLEAQPDCDRLGVFK